MLWGHAISHVCLLVPIWYLLCLPACADIYARYAEILWCNAALQVFWITSRVHMGSGVCFVSHALRGALVAIVMGVASVGPTIFCGFVAPYVVREVPAAESALAIGSPSWLVSSPVFAGITAAFAALVFVSGVILVLLWGLLLPLLPRL